MSVESAESERRFPRRFLIAASGAAVATGAVQAITSPASAADGATTWKLGGNAAVSGDGSNFIGPLNAAPLIFKTRLGTGALTERMRIGQNGHVSVGVPSTTAQFGVRTAEATAAAGTSTNASSSATGVQGTADGGAGLRGNSVNNYGVYGTGGYCGVRGQGGTYGSLSSGSSVGAYGSGADYGVYGSGGSYGVYGGGSTYGVYGSGPTGVLGSGSTYGVSGTTSNLNSAAVLGSGGQYGVHGINARTAGSGRLRLRRRLGPGDHVRRLRPRHRQRGAVLWRLRRGIQWRVVRRVRPGQHARRWHLVEGRGVLQDRPPAGPGSTSGSRTRSSSPRT